MTSQTDVTIENASSLNAAVVLACVPSCVAFAVFVRIAHHTPALVDVADTFLTIVIQGARVDAAVVFACIAIANGAVVVDLAHHAPAVVSVADTIATATFIV